MTVAGDRAEAGVRSVQVTLDIIEMLAGTETELGVTEIASRLGLTKGSVFRHVATLMERGYLAQNQATSRYRWGPRLYLLGRMMPARYDLIAAAEDAMRELRDELDQTVVLSGLTPRAVTVLATANSHQQVEIGVRQGSELPLNASAQGKVALAFGPASLRERLRTSGFVRFTEHTIIDPDRLDRELRLVRQRGWATAPGEVLLGINTVAVPVIMQGGELAGTLALVGSIQFIGATPTERQIAGLRRAAAQIAQRMAPGPVMPGGRAVPARAASHAGKENADAGA